MASPNPIAVESQSRDLGIVLELARAGDADAFSELYRAYSTRLLRQAMALCGNPALAEELAKDTLVEAWKSLRRYNGRCEFFTWLCAILLNRYHNSIRRNRFAWFSGHRGDNEFTDALEKLADEDSWPDHAVEQREQAALVWRCILLLPYKHQQVIILRFYVDNSMEGIAAALGCSVGTVKSRLFHALEKLRRMKALQSQRTHLKL